jgi:hypothetical protein
MIRRQDSRGPVCSIPLALPGERTVLCTTVPSVDGFMLCMCCLRTENEVLRFSSFLMPRLTGATNRSRCTTAMPNIATAPPRINSPIMLSAPMAEVLAIVAELHDFPYECSSERNSCHAGSLCHASMAHDILLMMSMFVFCWHEGEA